MQAAPPLPLSCPPNPTTITANWRYNGGGGGISDGSSSVTVTLSAPKDIRSPKRGEFKASGTADSGGRVTAGITGKTVTDAFDKALAGAREKSAERQGVAVVLRVDTGKKTGSRPTVNLPKTVQDAIIEKKIVNTVVVAENPTVGIGLDLAAVREVRRQANSDVHITAARAPDYGVLGRRLMKIRWRLWG